MEKLAMAFIIMAACMLATIQIGGIIKGRIPLFGFSTKLAAPLDATEKKLAILAGVLFLIGVIALIASF